MRTRTSDDPVVPSWALRAVIIGAVLVLIGAATPQGALVAGDAQRFLNYYAGVFALLATTIAVVSGLLATERLILKIRHRVLAQAVHRAASVLAVTFVVAHLLVKVLGGLAGWQQVIVPSTGPIGYGALAFDLILVIVASGLLRARFAHALRPWMWRSVHALAYVSWPLAIVHGLTAGRAAPAWATLSYVLSIGVVALAVLTRMIVVVKPREVRRTSELLSKPGAAQAAREGRVAEREAVGREAAGRRAPVRGAARAEDDPSSTEVLR